jgi:hypothetical protein
MSFSSPLSQQVVYPKSGVPQYFFNDELIASSRKVTRKWMQAQLFPRPVITPDRPWEGHGVYLYGSVLKDAEHGYRMYYYNSRYKNPKRGKHKQFVMMAISLDGMAWEKPNLGLVEWNGHTDNNIVLCLDHFDSPSVIYDPEDLDSPYKMIIFLGGEAEGLHVYGSLDGLTWVKKQEGPCLYAGDRTNLVETKHDGKYLMYTRHRRQKETEGVRCVFYSESTDFVNWSELELVLKPGLEDAVDAEFYGMGVFERHGWLFGLVEYWYENSDEREIHLVYSRDGKNWSRTPQQPLIAGNYEWSRNFSFFSTASSGPIEVDASWVFYVDARRTGHALPLVDNYSAIGYATLPIDHFCALEADSGGQFVTVPMEWPGGELVVNADTRESQKGFHRLRMGEIRVDILDGHGLPIEGWSGEDAALFQGTTHDFAQTMSGAVKWKNGQRMDDWKGKIIQLRFRMKHARLYTFMAEGAT